MLSTQESPCKEIDLPEFFNFYKATVYPLLFKEEKY